MRFIADLHPSFAANVDAHDDRPHVTRDHPRPVRRGIGDVSRLV